MSKNRGARLAALLFVLLSPACRAAAPDPAPRVPAGFRIEIWADGIRGARSLARGEHGTVFVGTREGGSVYAIPVSDGRAGKPQLIASGLNQPNGVAVHDGALYVAEIDRITRYPDIESRLDTALVPQVVRNDLPTETHHGWRYIAFGPDGRLYLPIGAPCNVCEPATFTRDGDVHAGRRGAAIRQHHADECRRLPLGAGRPRCPQLGRL